MPRKFASRAGSRDPKYRAGYGRVTDHRVALLVTETTSQLTLNEYNAHEDEDEVEEEVQRELSSEPGNSYFVLIPVPGRYRPLVWNLTGMTKAELDSTRQFFNHAFDQAEPVVVERDKVAADAFNQGDDSYIRIYRRIPQFVKRPRKKRQDSKSVHNGSSNATEGPGD